MVKSVARRNNTILLGKTFKKITRKGTRQKKKKRLRDSQQTKSESNRVLTKGGSLRNSSPTGVVPLNSGPLRKTIAMAGVGYLESGRLQLRALASVGKKQLNLGRLFKILYCKAHLYWQGVRILKRETKSTYNTALLFCLFVCFCFCFCLRNNFRSKTTWAF